jgi:hypothetical protein
MDDTLFKIFMVCFVTLAFGLICTLVCIQIDNHKLNDNTKRIEQLESIIKSDNDSVYTIQFKIDK